MSKLIKGILAVIGIFFTVFLALLLYVLTLDPNDHKDWLADNFQEDTGRELTLAGDISVTYYPWLGLSVNDVTVSNDPAFGSEPMLHVDSASVRLKLMSLLQGQFEIDTVQIYGARANLAVNEAGQANWDIFSSAAADPASPDTADQPANLSNIILGGVDIRDAGVSYEDRRSNERYDVSGFSMSTGELVYGDPISFQISFDASSSQPQLAARTELSGTVTYSDNGDRYDINPLQLEAVLSGPNVPENASNISLQTAVLLDLDADTLTVDNLDLSAPGTSLSASVSGRAIQSERPGYDITLNLQGDDLSLLFEIAEINDLAERIASLDSRNFDIALDMTTDTGRGNLTVSSLQADLLGATVEGDLNASRLQTDAPIIRGNMLASGPDLPTLVEVLGQIQGGRDSDLASYGRELSRVPDKAFSLDTAFDADIEQGSVVIPTLDARILGATITGSLTANNIQTDTPRVSGRLNAAGPDLPLMLQIAGQLQGGTDSVLNQYGRQLRTGVSNRAFTINTEFNADMESGNIQLPVLSANMLGFQLNGNLSGNNLQDSDGTLSGALNLSGNNMREVLASIGQSELGDVMQRVLLTVEIGGTSNNISISPLNLDLVFAGSRIPNSPVNITLNADTRLNLEQESLSLQTFSVRGMGLDINGNLDATNVIEAPEFSGQLDVAAFNLRQFLQQLNQTIPPMADGSTLQNVSLSGAFNGSLNHFNLNDLALGLDESSLAGNFSVTDFENPATEFSFEIDRLNADRYLAPETAPATTGQNTGAAEIPVESLRDLTLRGQLSVGQLTYSNMRLTDVGLQVSAAGGQLNVIPSTSLYEGRYEGEIRLDVSGSTPSARINSTLIGVELGPLMQDYMGARYVSGTGNVFFDINANGADTMALQRSLSGTGNIQLEDGVLQGVDVGEVLKQVETMIRNRRLGQVTRGERTEFDTFSSTLNINNGIVTSNDLMIESPGFNVSGRGTLLDLNDETLNFNLVTTVDESTSTDEQYDIGGYSLPIACTGTISSPRCLPDVQTLVQAALANAVQRGVSDLLQRAVGGQQQQDTQNNQQTQPQDQQEQEQEQQEPAEELINRALDRLFQ